MGTLLAPGRGKDIEGSTEQVVSFVRGLIELRRSGGGAADIDAAWALAQRYGEMIRLLPACAALVERAWLTEGDDERVDIGRDLLMADVRTGLEWARGDLALWMRRLDPAVEVKHADSLAEPYRIKVVKATDKTSLSDYVADMPEDRYKKETLELINAMYPNKKPPPGALFKIVE